MAKKPSAHSFITIQVTSDMCTTLKRRAKDMDLTTSSLMRRLIRNFLNGQQGQSTPSNTGGSGNEHTQQHRRAA